VRKRTFWLLAVLVELGVLTYMLSKYKELEYAIFMVQGQNASRYAELHQDWIQLSGAIILVMLVLPISGYYLKRNWSK
jgi:hypothetical protein